MNNKIIRYRALSSRDTIDLSQSVESWIARGYQPFGPMTCSVALSDDGAYEYDVYAQAMVEYEKADAKI